MRAILTWHSIDDSGSPISISRRQFLGQLEWLAGSGVPVTSVATLLASPPEDPGVALTFDDGFSNFAREAAPLLHERGWPSTVFVVAGHVGRQNDWGGARQQGIPTLPLMDWDTLGRLRQSGVTIAAHTRRHPRLDRITDAARLADELEGSARDIEAALGERPAGLAYPYGASTPGVRAAAAASFAWACTTDLRPLARREDRFRLPRLDAWYLREPRHLGPWGARRLRGWLRLRRAGRQFRAAVRGEA